MAQIADIDVAKLGDTIQSLPIGHQHVLLDLLAGKVPAHRAMWPPAEDLDRGMRSLEERIPRAANATETHMKGFLHTDERGSRYKVQEKLNGVHVLWDGAQLWTKTGHPVDVPPQFRSFLPPSFAFAGELFFGYGHREFSFATTVSQNQLPTAKVMEAGASPAGTKRVWQHARIVAFDTPMAQDRPYSDRHRLLWQVVASWSRHQYQSRGIDFSLLPLQVIVQYPPSTLAAVFQEVVHGVGWRTRKYLPFGIPIHRTTAVERFVAGQRVSLHTAGDGVVYYQTQHQQNREILFGSDTDAECSGEGCMLWDQHATWEGRGSADRATVAILKFKPRAVTVGTVTSAEPQHTHRYRGPAADGAEEGASGRLPGYTISVDWWDNLHGQWRSLRPYVSANFGAARCATLFPQDAMVFFTFVMFDQQPMFLRALGTHLSRWDALNVKGMLEVRKSDPDLTAGERRLAARPVDDVLRADAWHHGDVCALFPVAFAWSPMQWLRCSGAQHSRRIAANPALAPDAGWSAKNKNTVLAQTQAAARNRAAQRKERLAKLQERLDAAFATWFQTPHPVSELFTVCLLLTAAWVTRTDGAMREWLGASGGRGLVAQWGPFEVVEAAANAPHAERWVSAQLRLFLTVVASLWLQFGGMFPFGGYVSTDAMDAATGASFVDSLRDAVDAFLRDTVIPRWEDAHVRSFLWPPNVAETRLFINTSGAYTQHFSLEVVARYAMFVVHGSWKTVPVEPVSVPFRVHAANGVRYVLNGSQAYADITGLSDAMKTRVDNVVATWMDLGWVLQPDDVPLNPRSLLPELQLPPAEEVVDVVPSPRTYEWDLEEARRAAKRQLRLMAHHTVF